MLRLERKIDTLLVLFGNSKIESGHQTSKAIHKIKENRKLVKG